MSVIRFDLPKNCDISKVYDWMNHHIGPQQEGVTWFWSVRVENENGIQHHRDGVKIWQHGPECTLATLVWGQP